MLFRLTLICAALLLSSAQAFAHHPVQVTRDSFETDVIAAHLSVDHAAFDIQARRGTWTRMTLQALYAPLSWLHLEASLPMAWVREEGNPERFGLTDIEVGVKVRPYTAPSGVWYVETGLGLELPTGDSSAGLGGGHFALIPSLAMRVNLSETLHMQGSLALASSLNAHAHAPGSWHSILAIHAMHELGARIDLVYADDLVRAKLAVQSLQGLSAPNEAGPTSLITGASLALSGGWALQGEFEVPFAGQRRTAWRASLGVGWRMAFEQEAEHVDCDCPK